MEVISPPLLPCLSLLSAHLTHLIPSLPKMNSNIVYRAIANTISTPLVDRVVLTGGAHRFSQWGGIQFRQDVLQGWMSVVNDVATLELKRLPSGTMTALGKKPEAPWQYLLDVSFLLSLPGKSTIGQMDDNYASVTLEDACNAAFQEQSTWNVLRQKLGIDDRMDLRLVQEILRRRIDSPR